MPNVLRIAVVDPEDASHNALKSMLLGLDTVWLEAECSRYEFFGDVVAQTNPDVGFVALDANPDKALELVASLAKTSRISAGLGHEHFDGWQPDPAYYAGWHQRVSHPAAQDRSLSGAPASRQATWGQLRHWLPHCSIIAITGATGGVGSTSVAVNLACSLAANEANSVVLLDLDVALGDADVFLDTIPDYTLSDVAQNVSAGLHVAQAVADETSSGLYLLPRPVQLEEVRLITPDELYPGAGTAQGDLHAPGHRSVERLQRARHGRSEAANHVLMVTQLDLPCLRNVVRLMMSFEEIGRFATRSRSSSIESAGNGQISLKKPRRRSAATSTGRCPTTTA